MLDAIWIEAVTPQAVSSRFGLSPQALSNWRRRGIPLGKRLPFKELAAERGVTLPDNFLSAPAERAAARQ
jgi:hypothetical protein